MPKLNKADVYECQAWTKDQLDQPIFVRLILNSILSAPITAVSLKPKGGYDNSIKSRGGKMADRYTKVVLTVIAVCLAIIAMRDLSFLKGACAQFLAK